MLTGWIGFPESAAAQSTDCAAPESDPAPADNTQTFQTRVVDSGTGVDLVIAKTDSADPVTAGDQFNYTLAVQNVGTQAATQVVVTDVLPAGVSFVSVTPDQGSCSVAGQQITCSLGTLAAGASTDIVISVTASTAALLSNVASVTSAEPELTPANNTATETTMVGAGEGCAAATFAPAQTIPLVAGLPYEIASGDFDEDGIPDLVMGAQSTTGGVHLVLDPAGSGLTRFTPFSVARPLVVADFNGDDHLDVAVAGARHPDCSRGPVLLGPGQEPGELRDGQGAERFEASARLCQPAGRGPAVTGRFQRGHQASQELLKNGDLHGCGFPFRVPLPAPGSSARPRRPKWPA